MRPRLRLSPECSPASFPEHSAEGFSQLRYYSGPVARAMKARDAEAWRPARRPPTGGAAQDAASPLPAPSFLPLTVDEERGVEPAPSGGGSPDSDWLAAQTVAFNVQSREHPEDLQNWLDFAAFQV